jgi:3-methylcrotonyl-CoA carboxylase alpha subunit
MFRTLLVANRGEIACRIIRSARRLGVRTVAVYSEPDAGAMHVRLADEARYIGTAPAADSYLNIARLIAAAQAAGAEAIHPGYGFLAENENFARACLAAGIAFVGPSADTIAAMGDKARARQLMRQAQVPLLPGYDDIANDDASLIDAARKLGLPLIVKPSAGGGGKGMSVINDEAQIEAALASCRRTAHSAFGNDALILERYLPDARHVEVQVLADQHGAAITIFDRDCSVQRRHQKLIEEAPAPGLAAELRVRLHQAALSVARSVNYHNAGTVEFLLQDNEFYFLEMNTRLQVEHGVTEYVAGIDLVEWQLRIASGEALPSALVPDKPNGHAIEVRICAENPDHDFLPASGALSRLDWPAASADLRVDAGFASGDVVPEYYDSLLGKVIAWGVDRQAAINRLERALGELRIAGVHTNSSWLRHAIAQEGFRNVIPTTRFVAQLPAPKFRDEFELQAVALAWHCERNCISTESASPWDLADGFRIGMPHSQTRYLHGSASNSEWSLTRLRPGQWQVEALARSMQLQLRSLGTSWTAELPDYIVRFEPQLIEDRIIIWTSERQLELQLFDPRSVSYQAAPAVTGLGSVLPGIVAMLLVKPGDAVEAGQKLVVVEAMKMEHVIVAPSAGRVVQLLCAVGDQVKAGKDLLVLE